MDSIRSFISRQCDLAEFEIERLNGYDNINYLVTTPKERFILKTYKFDADLKAHVEAEIEILLLLNNSCYPVPLAFEDGSYLIEENLNGQPMMFRMLRFVDGQLLGDIQPDLALYKNIGAQLASLHLSLKEIKSPVIQSRVSVWEILQLYLNKPRVQHIELAHDRAIVEYFLLQFQEVVWPELPGLRRSLIHNDANEWNILIEEDQVVGLIDFGDMAYAPVINELAVCLTYMCYDKDEPLGWAVPVLQGFHKRVPIYEEEIELLYYLIGARLSASLCNSAHARVTDPENAYAGSSEENCLRLLRKWVSIGPVQATNEFRSAVGFPFPETTDESLTKRQAHIPNILSISYNRPIEMAGAAFQYMYGANGETFLDAYNNIPHVGHCHPKVVEAGQRQMARLNTNTRYLYHQLGDYAERLLSKFPTSLNRIIFVNSGSEASDLALRMARKHTGKSGLAVMEHGYHGHTQGPMSVSHYKFSNKKGSGQSEHVLSLPLPDDYRGKHAGKPKSGELFAADAVESIKSFGLEIGAFIAEPIVGCGGQVPLADGYLRSVYPEIKSMGGVCISDEVQTRFGRLGAWFWGFEMHDVIPDIVVLGKPMGNGHPIGAVVCTEKVANSFDQDVEFFSSFGGNPVSCEIGMAVLEVIEEEGLQLNAKMVGDYYKSELVKLKDEFAVIGDVRGSGLFLGVEIVGASTDAPNTLLAQRIKNELRNAQVLVSTDGPNDNVIKTKPPLCFNKGDVDEVVEKLRLILSS